MDRVLIDILSENMKEVFVSMINRPIEECEQTRETDCPDLKLASVISIVDHGETIGYVSLHVSEETAGVLYQSILGEDELRENADTASAVNEILNIVVGRAMTMIKAAKPGLIFGLPKIFRDNDAISEDCSINAETVGIPFRMNGYHLLMKVCL